MQSNCTEQYKATQSDANGEKRWRIPPIASKLAASIKSVLNVANVDPVPY